MNTASALTSVSVAQITNVVSKLIVPTPSPPPPPPSQSIPSSAADEKRSSSSSSSTENELKDQLRRLERHSASYSKREPILTKLIELSTGSRKTELLEDRAKIREKI